MGIYSGRHSGLINALSAAITNGEPLKYWKATYESAPENSAQFSQYLAIGKKFISEKRYHEAIEVYQKAIELDGENDKVFVYQGYAYFRNQQPFMAETALEKALSLNPNSALAYYNLALNHLVFIDQYVYSNGLAKDSTSSAADKVFEEVRAEAASELLKSFELDPSLKAKAQEEPLFKNLFKTNK